MIEQAEDFREECDALYRILEPLDDKDFEKKTLFKQWTLNDVLGHLHVWNWAANASLVDEPAFKSLMDRFGGHSDMNAAERSETGGASGKALLKLWHDYYGEMADNFHQADPKKRLLWAGPTMSARSSVSARLMETWSHSQAIYDVLGLERVSTDRVKNIVVLGINTYGFCYANRGLEPPGPIPLVRLTGPSGAVWTMTEPNETDRIEGDAVEFCQVITQCRNIADTSLKVEGEVAKNWMSIAQCFAGPPETPPPLGARHRAS